MKLFIHDTCPQISEIAVKLVYMFCAPYCRMRGVSTITKTALFVYKFPEYIKVDKGKK